MLLAIYKFTRTSRSSGVGRATYLPQMRTPIAMVGKVNERRIRAGETSIAQNNFGFIFEREFSRFYDRTQGGTRRQGNCTSSRCSK